MSEDETSPLKQPTLNKNNVCSYCCLFPKSVFFILVTEFCERFTFYGTRAIIVIYFVNQLMLSQNQATTIAHFFVFATYFTPLIGSFIADSFFGRYWTILSLSVVYLIGCSTLTIGSLPPPSIITTLIGLSLIGLGAGGIKPCVSSMGADQLLNEELQAKFFSLFYFMINLGALLSSITPVLHSKFQCFKSDCFSLGFGLPAILMLLALIVFISGSPLYVKKPPQKNVITEVFCCIWYAIRNYFKQRKERPGLSLLDYAADKYDSRFLNDIRQLGKIVILFLPMPIYSALNDQILSRWTLQSAQLDGYIFADWVILADQVSYINTLLVLMLIPIFEIVIYPSIAWITTNFSLLRRMVIGLFLISVAFAAAFILQLNIEKSSHSPVPTNQVDLNLLSLQSCPLTVNVVNKNITWTISSIEYKANVRNLDSSAPEQLNIFAEIMPCASHPQLTSKLTTSVNSSLINPSHSYTIIVWLNENAKKLNVDFIENSDRVVKVGKSKLRVISQDTANLKQSSLKLVSKSKTSRDFTIPLNVGATKSNELLVTQYDDELYRARYEAAVEDTLSSNSKVLHPMGIVDIKNNEIGSIILYKIPVTLPTNVSSISWKFHYLVEREGSQLSIFLQLPQYIILTIAEILFFVSGFAFSYMAAPLSMKATVSALFLSNVAFGNLIVMLVSYLNLFTKQSQEFLFFFAIGILATIILALLAYFYKPIASTGEASSSYELMKEIPLTSDERVE